MSSPFSTLQKILPQHGLSRLAGHLASSESPWLKNLLIEQFARIYKVQLDEAERPHIEDYRSFNDFFTRGLRPEARPLPDDPNVIVCPADGAISQAGVLRDDQLVQAKGHTYSLASLAGELGQGFENGSFCTVYLSPKDYHRVHLPADGTLTESLAIPGALFSVNAHTEEHISGLFARNERLVCRFETRFGAMLVILVGAMIVASIETDWEGPPSPYHIEELSRYHLVYDRGDEIGRFLLGSTVICCFPPNTVALEQRLAPGTQVKMGQPIGIVNHI